MRRLWLCLVDEGPYSVVDGALGLAGLRRARSMFTRVAVTRQLLRTYRSLAAQEVPRVAHAGRGLVAAK